ncbi:MAG TPA: hypothetical protein VFI59_10550 [Actinomycetota bacterium]|nr:hypothetical protein [Actinomycetota bacterium]
MDDYSALAQRISVSVSGVSGALILSRDGLVLGAHPNEDESLAKPAWLKFVTLGEPDRSFVEFPDQVWAYVKRGPYAAFATAQAGTRPGILVDQMEQVLLIAEDGRARRDTLRVPDSNAAPSGKPRTSLHPSADNPSPVEVTAGPRERGATAAFQPDRRGFSQDPGGKGGKETFVAAGDPEGAPVADVAPSTLKKKHRKLAGTGGDLGFDEDAEVDRVLLAKEFSGLLQVDSEDDEGSS